MKSFLPNNFPVSISGCSKLILTLHQTPYAEITDLRTQRSREVVSIMSEKRHSSPERVGVVTFSFNIVKEIYIVLNR